MTERENERVLSNGKGELQFVERKLEKEEKICIKLNYSNQK